MDRSEMRQGHVELWTWLSENPNEEKCEWPGWDNKYERSENLCFACEVAKNGADELNVYLHCRHCPIEWSGDDENCRCLSTGAEYFDWTEWQVGPCKTKQKARRERAKLAKKIAGMWPEEE